LASRNPCSPPTLLEDVAYGPGLTAVTVVSGLSPCYSGTGAPTSPGRLKSSRVALVDPVSPGRSGAATCDGQTITGQTAPTGLGAPDPPPPGKGSGAATCRPAEGVGLARPRACGWRPFAGLQPTYQHLIR
jgi:hypothetical protein